LRFSRDLRLRNTAESFPGMDVSAETLVSSAGGCADVSAETLVCPPIGRTDVSAETQRSI
jgi:hypothetical protein